ATAGLASAAALALAPVLRPAPSSLAQRVQDLETVTAPIDVVGGDLVISSVNVHVRNGSGSSFTPNGKGNLLVGYRTLDPATGFLTGSHNLVLGTDHVRLAGTCGVVAGAGHSTDQIGASVSGGFGNVALNQGASVLGGVNNQALGPGSTVSGGRDNEAQGDHSSVVGGLDSHAGGAGASVLGGHRNAAFNEHSTAIGGADNSAQAPTCTVVGGKGNLAGRTFIGAEITPPVVGAVVIGGRDNKA
ncbi:MAG: hypothetical protein AAFP86_21580, partial [Planctomycetota bacterium]